MIRFPLQPGGAGGGVVALQAQVIDIDGTIDVSGSDAQAGAGGGSGGSVQILADRFIGKGRLLCNGGKAVNNGGGGSGGRLSVHCNETEFSGRISALGGASSLEPGGPGTIYRKTGTGYETLRNLEINNGGHVPVDTYLVSRNQYENSGKAWVLVQSIDDLKYDELRLLGGAHASFVLSVKGDVSINKFSGDNTGMLHVQADDRVVIKSAPAEFPSWFRVYERGYLSLPEIVHLNKFLYSQLFIEGKLGYIKDFRIGTGVTVSIGNKVTIPVYYQRNI
jgi:hypothetical protein